MLAVRRIKEKLSGEAARIGPEKFYLSLNGTAARLTGRYRTTPRTLRPGGSATGKAKRHVSDPSGALVLHDKPVKYKTH